MISTQSLQIGHTRGLPVFQKIISMMKPRTESKKNLVSASFSTNIQIAFVSIPSPFDEGIPADDSLTVSISIRPTAFGSKTSKCSFPGVSLRHRLV